MITPDSSPERPVPRPPIPACAYFGEDAEQTAFDVAVVTPTVGRPALADAIESVFRQDFRGRIQILVGFDIGGAIPDFLWPLMRRRPPNVSVLMLHLPYSTSMRHGGLHRPSDGGALRTILSYMANSRHIAYLDDDNRWRPPHLRLLRQAVEGKAYAFAPRLLIDGESGKSLGLDVWDSVGPGKGRHAARGGFVDPNCLMIDKLAVGAMLGRWAELAEDAKALDAADQWLFKGLSDLPFGSTDEATVEYRIRPTNVLRRLADAANAANAPSPSAPRP
jgi:hypothetical protein